MRHTRLFATVLAIAALSGCAGTDFVRPTEGAFTLGRSTAADVTAKMGAPRKTGEVIKNEKQLKVYSYAYASTGGESAYPGVTPARGMTFSFHDDKLTSQEFVSSFKADSTDYDKNKISQIIKGKSSKSDVISLLGKPTGEAIYPMIKGVNDQALIYSYSHAKGSVFNMKFFNQILIVSFGKDGIVSDVEFTTSGEK